MKFALGTNLILITMKIVQVKSKKRQIWRMKKCSKKTFFSFAMAFVLGMQWSDIIIMYLGVLYFWNIQWWFRLQFPFFFVYFARCKLSYISCSLSLSLSGWSHLWFFNGFCLPNDQKGAINANCNRNQSFAPINPNILSRFLSACLLLLLIRPSVNVIHHMPILASDSKSFQ